jgi:hypothetical protein
VCGVPRSTRERRPVTPAVADSSPLAPASFLPLQAGGFASVGLERRVEDTPNKCPKRSGVKGRSRSGGLLNLGLPPKPARRAFSSHARRLFKRFPSTNLDRIGRSEVRYARSGEINIAYQVTGDGPFDLVLVPGFISHLELDWSEPRHARFLDRLGSFARLIRFDKRGTGLSDRPSVLGEIETRMDDVRAVMDAVGVRARRSSPTGKGDRWRCLPPPSRSGRRHSPSSERLPAEPAPSTIRGTPRAKSSFVMQTGSSRLGGREAATALRPDHRCFRRRPEDSVERDRHSISAEQELELRDVPAAAAASELAPAELVAAPATERGARPGPGDPVRHEVVPTLEALRRCARHRAGDPVEAVVELPLELE